MDDDDDEEEDRVEWSTGVPGGGDGGTPQGLYSTHAAQLSMYNSYYIQEEGCMCVCVCVCE